MAIRGVEISGFTTVQWDRLLHPRIQDFEIEIAEKALKAAVARGFDPEPMVITDGVANRDWHDVKPFGRIEWRRKSTTAQAVQWIVDQLRIRSPVGSFDNDAHPGLYARSHTVLVNGVVTSVDDVDKAGPGDEVQIVNIQPYAGKIEGRDAFTRWETRYNKYFRTGHSSTLRRAGRRRKAGWSRSQMAGESSQAPRGVYRVVLEEAIRQFGRSVVITYAPVELTQFTDGGVTHITTARSRRRGIRKDQVVRPAFTVVSKSLFV